jgi:hypothetical protein
MVVGSIWYAPKVLGNKWAKLAQLTPAHMRKGMARGLAITFAASLITAYILAHMIFVTHKFFANNYMQDAVTTAFWLWLGFTAARILVHDIFEKRPIKLTLITLGNELVILLVMGVIIGLFVPAVVPA